MEMADETKPSLTLVKGVMTADQVEKLYKLLTGKDVTPEERKRIEERMKIQSSSHDD